MNKHTLVIGASTNPERYSYKAINMLTEYGHEVSALSKKPGTVANVEFITEMNAIEGIDTITLYVGPKNQAEYYEYILSLSPKRVIFNPGTENDELIDLLEKNNIEAEIACTLVMLRSGQF
jgi:uncharacterized protein